MTLLHFPLVTWLTKTTNNKVKNGALSVCLHGRRECAEVTQKRLRVFFHVLAESLLELFGAPAEIGCFPSSDAPSGNLADFARKLQSRHHIGGRHGGQDQRDAQIDQSGQLQATG